MIWHFFEWLKSAFSVDISKGLTISHMTTHPASARYPDASAITYDEHNFKVTVVYNDHSIYVWDVRDIKKVSSSTEWPNEFSKVSEIPSKCISLTL